MQSMRLMGDPIRINAIHHEILYFNLAKLASLIQSQLCICNSILTSIEDISIQDGKSWYNNK